MRIEQSTTDCVDVIVSPTVSEDHKLLNSDTSTVLDLLCKDNSPSQITLDLNQTIFPKCIEKGLKVTSHNVNRILANNGTKLDQIRLVLETDKPPVDIYGICETFLTNKVEDNSVNIKGYQTIRKDREYSNGGGLLIYVRDGLNFKRREDLESKDTTIESIWIEIVTSNKNFILSMLYRPPGSNVNDWLNDTEEKLNHAFSEDKNLVLMGDFNIDILKDSTLKQKWTDVFEMFDLEQIIQQPTRVTQSTQTLIDHIYVSRDTKLLHQCVVEFNLSDHKPVYACFDTKIPKSKLPDHHLSIKYRNLKKLDHEQLATELINAPWSCYDSESVNDALDNFTVIFNSVINKQAPLVTKRVKKATQPGWITDEILELINKRDTAKRKNNHNLYKQLRNIVTEKINEAKSNHYKTFVETNQNNPGKLSKMFSKLSGKEKQNNPIPSIITNDITLTEEEDIADTFNRHFTDIVDKYLPHNQLEVPEDWQPTSDLNAFITSRIPVGHNFKIPPIQEHFVHNFLAKLDTKKATGLDEISANILKITNPYITHVITHICNLSIKTNTFPDKWKHAKVTPLFKKNSKHDVNNYRPISILPILSKIIEKHVALQLYEYLNVHKLISARQSGFRPQHSCETALHQMLDEWYNSISKNQSIGILFVDFCKAFDMVDRDILMKKLKVYKFSDNALTWFDSYLSNRKQCVKVNSTLSSKLTVKSGVPQGSILGPLLFLVYINDLPLEPKLDNTTMFADDATSSASAQTDNEVGKELQIKANNMDKWCAKNKMVLNADKTKFMLLKPKRMAKATHQTKLKIEVQGKQLGQVPVEKLLGVQIDEALSWDAQIKKQKQTIFFKISFLNKIRKYLPLATRKLFYNSYIKPHFDYCNTIWSNTTKANIDKIYKLQKYAARIILDEKLQKENTTPSAVLFQKLDWITFRQNVHYRQAILMYKSLNNEAPPYMRDMFNYVNEVGVRNSRSSTQNKLYQPVAHPKSLRYTGPKIWNSLDADTRNAKNIKQFKNNYLRQMPTI